MENKIVGNHGYGVSLVKDNIANDIRKQVDGVHLALSRNTIQEKTCARID